jgi:hypothetical protein
VPALYRTAAEPRDKPETPARDFTEADWQERLEFLNRHGTWSSYWGPKPGEPNCLVPAHLLVKPVSRTSPWRGLLLGALTPSDSRLITPETTSPLHRFRCGRLGTTRSSGMTLGALLRSLSGLKPSAMSV